MVCLLGSLLDHVRAWVMADIGKCPSEATISAATFCLDLCTWICVFWIGLVLSAHSATADSSGSVLGARKAKERIKRWAATLVLACYVIVYAPCCPLLLW